MNQKYKINHIGLVGLGLMGQGMATNLIASGFQVTAYSRSRSREQETIEHITESLEKLIKEDVVQPADIEGWESRFQYVPEVEALKDCEFILETVGESLELKKMIYQKLESVIGAEVVIASNTSGISISLLQEQLTRKERFAGMHWGEPAEISRYVEISRGKETNEQTIEMIVQVGEQCGKNPTVLNYDVPGLISNRLMYAMLREAIHLVETGVADVETVDRSFRNDMGWWATIAGPFRWMDLTGLPIYAEVIKGLFPELNNGTEVPDLMKEKVETGTKFYDYSKDSEEEWESVWSDFSHDIRKIVNKYEKRVKM